MAQYSKSWHAQYTDGVKKFFEILLAVVIFLVPTNLFLVLTEVNSRVHGLRVDYLLPKLYLSDILIGAATVVGLVVYKKTLIPAFKRLLKNQTFQISGVFFVLFSVFQLTLQIPILSVWLLAKLLLFTLFFAVAWQLKTKIPSKVSIFAVAATIMLQSLVGIYQFGMQKSLAGYWFLGETNISSFAGLAKTTHGGIEKVLPYGTTAHPNVLGGVLAVYLLIYLQLSTKPNSAVLGLGLCCLLLTQSFSALLVFMFGLLWLFLQNKPARKLIVALYVTALLVVPLLLPFWKTSNASITRRGYLSVAGWQMFVANPVAGVGVGAFTSQVEKYSPTKEVVRFVQPAHHVGILLLAEIGLVGILTIVTIVYKLYSKKTHHFLLQTLGYAALLSLPLLVLDHYVYTLQSGQLLLVILLLWCGRRSETW